MSLPPVEDRPNGYRYEHWYWLREWDLPPGGFWFCFYCDAEFPDHATDCPYVQGLNERNAMTNPYTKAIAAIVGALVSVLVAFNVDISEELQAAIIVVVSALAVFIAPPNAPTVDRRV